MLGIVIFYTILTIVFTFGKEAVLHATPLFLTAVRIAGGGICFLLYYFLVQRARRFFKKEDLPYVAAFALNIFLLDFLRMQALITLPAANAALISCTAPFFAAFFSWWWFAERFGYVKILALLTGLIGMLPLLIPHLSMPCANIPLLIGAYGAIIISTISAVLTGILSKFLIDKRKCPFFLTVGTAMTGAGLLALVCSTMVDTWDPLPITNPSMAWRLIGLLFLLQSLIAYPLYNYLVIKYPVTLISFAQLSVPFLTAFLSWTLTGQAVRPNFFLSLAIMGCSFALFYKQERKEGLIDCQ